ncbi:MAG TPA: PPA1309 family protein [Kineosporiaceae bacterium]|nr:PPA1309 family protein [Kineosporiaceae bacterium]
METSEGTPSAGPSALERAVRELEQHVAGGGWDGPVRLFALIRTGAALERDPALAATLPAEVVQAAREDADHLTAVEQEGLPDSPSLESLLGRIAWPPTVDGAALVVERIVVPPEAETNLPEDPEQAQAALLNHPLRQDLRLAAGVLRDGGRMCAIRSRGHDSDDQVAVGPDLIPGLTEALAQTLD